MGVCLTMPLALALVIFDCDGVLIDSEALCDREISAELTMQGWDISAADCHRRFTGLPSLDIQQAGETYRGRALGTDWVDAAVGRVTEVMAAPQSVPRARPR